MGIGPLAPASSSPLVAVLKSLDLVPIPGFAYALHR